VTETRLWEDLSSRLRASAPYRALAESPGEVVRLPVPAAAWVVELLAEDSRRPALVVVPHESDALAWIEAAQLFAPGRRAGAPVYFPGPPCRPTRRRRPPCWYGRRRRWPWIGSSLPAPRAGRR
jgi:hypothetical protein